MFFKEWIKIEQGATVNNCEIIKLSEIPDTRESIYDELVKTVVNHYSHPRRIKRYLKDEKFSKLENYINNRIPTVSNHKLGDFGEIFGTEHLKQFYGYCFPVVKLRYKSKPNKSLDGEDILGFFIEDGEITRICVGESKVRSQSDSYVLEDALDQLKKSYNPHPILLKYYSDRIYENNGYSDEFGEKIEDLMSPDVFIGIEKDNWIFYITGFLPRKFNVDNSSDELDNLVLVHMYFNNLNEFVEDIYKDCGGHYNKR